MAEGLLELIDSVTAVAQTPQRVCSCVQRVERGVYVGGPTANRLGRFYNVKLGCGLRSSGRPPTRCGGDSQLFIGKAMTCVECGEERG